MNIKDIVSKKERFTAGHRLCAGCGIPTIVNTVLAATDDDVIVANATGCLEVASTIYPFTSWNTPWIHNTFENAAATISGVETAYKAMLERGKTDKKVKFVAFGGDGGTYDIGLQALSGALERRHNFVYVCYTNEAYMNTGIQRSGATPFGANTTTAPIGEKSYGKTQWRKDLTKIAVAHDIPYVAQATVHDFVDLSNKAQKAFNANGPAVLVVLQPCTTGWYYEVALTMKISKLAVDTNYWPLYEVENGKYKINRKPKERLPITEFLKPQKRFAHLFKPENQHILDEIQQHIDEEWAKLLKLEALSQQS